MDVGYVAHAMTDGQAVNTGIAVDDTSMSVTEQSAIGADRPSVSQH
jgi:hypothetical protein